MPSKTVWALFAFLCALVPASALPSSIDHANWMRDLLPLIGDVTLLDVTIPGSHDSMTYDLAPVVADGANDLPTNLTYFLHDLGNFLGLGDWVRNQVRPAA
jgi:hypothetical protein